MDWTGVVELAAVAILCSMIWLAGAAWFKACDYIDLQRALRQRAARRLSTGAHDAHAGPERA